MSLLIPTLADAAPVALDFTQIKPLLGEGLPWIVFWQLLVWVSFWISSKLVTREHGQFMNALKLWALYLLSFLGIGLLVGVGVFVGLKQQSNGIHFAAGIVGVVLLVVVVFVLP